MLDLSSVKTIAIFRALQLGDMLCAVPALRAIRATFPTAAITLIGLPWASYFVNRFKHYIDDFIGFPGFPGFPERSVEVSQWPSFLSGVQHRNFDLAIQLHGSGRITNSIVELFGAKLTAGFYPPKERCPNHHYFWPYPSDKHEIRRNLQLADSLGARELDESLEFLINPADQDMLASALKTSGSPLNNYVCLHPGARSLSKRWPAESFAQVGDYLADQGLDIILTGSASEQNVTQAVAKNMRSSSYDVAGLNLPLGPLAALLAGATLVVVNDTGIAHLSVATKTPSVVVFKSTDPRRWAPIDQLRHAFVDTRKDAGVPAVIDKCRHLLAASRPERRTLSHSIVLR